MPYGTPIRYTQWAHACQACGELGDFSNVNGHAIGNAMHYAQASSLRNCISALEEQGIQRPYIERVLNLPFGSVDRWVGGDWTPEAVALVRVLRTWPGLLDLADNGFLDSEEVADSGTTQ